MAETVRIRETPTTAKIRHPLAAFGWIFLTLGIYQLVWYYKVNRELRDLGRAVGREQRLGRSPLTSLAAVTLGWLIVVPPFVSFYGTLRRVEAAQDVADTDERVSVGLGFGLFVVGVVLLPVEVIHVQNEMNRVWRTEAERADSPEGSVVAAGA